jgi:hypothetical protein
MRVSRVYFTEEAKSLPIEDRLVPYREIIASICAVVWPRGSDRFVINSAERLSNGVVPIKDSCYVKLERSYLWFREKPLGVLQDEKKKGGPIDVYKEFRRSSGGPWRVGLEFETGNISSAHRSMNKLLLGLERRELDLGAILTPMKSLAEYLTDRVSNYEELEPYFELAEGHPFMFIGFRSDAYDGGVPLIPKGPDGQSNRAKRLWSKRS